MCERRRRHQVIFMWEEQLSHRLPISATFYNILWLLLSNSRPEKMYAGAGFNKKKEMSSQIISWKRSEYLLEDLWEEKKSEVQGLLRSAQALIYLSYISFPRTVSVLCRFNRASSCFISWFRLKTQSRVQCPDQGVVFVWASHTLISFPVTNIRSCISGEFSIQMCQLRDESFCCQMLFSISIIGKKSWVWSSSIAGILTIYRPWENPNWPYT